MKTRYAITTFIIITLFGACKSVNSLTKEQIIEKIDLKIEKQEYTVAAKRANPSSGRSINLTSSYSLTVKPDTITAFLPYYGRAYTAPNPMEEGGIKFTSTDFEYSTSEKEKGIYRVSIKINDNANHYRLSLLVGETGSTTLYVIQTNKQAITFYGDIE